MAGPTKMIVITSDADIIRKLSLNKTVNTRISCLIKSPFSFHSPPLRMSEYVDLPP
jgi:hypothetical protein